MKDPRANINFDISIHALREERDSDYTDEKGRVLYFNPRAPRGARRNGQFRTV